MGCGPLGRRCSLKSRTTRRRLIYVMMTLLVIMAGLALRRPELGLSLFVAKYGGSALWGAMVFCIVATLLPGAWFVTIAAYAAVISAVVEFSQLLQVDWLNDFRRTTTGRLLLGATFTWWDIASYWIGIAVAASVVAVATRRPQSMDS